MKSLKKCFPNCVIQQFLDTSTFLAVKKCFGRLANKNKVFFLKINFNFQAIFHRQKCSSSILKELAEKSRFINKKNRDFFLS